MKTHILRIHWFAFSCIVSLLLPWGSFCGEDVTASSQKPALDILIGRINKVEEKGIAYDKANPPSKNWGGWTELACQLLESVEKLGDSEALNIAISCENTQWIFRAGDKILEGMSPRYAKSMERLLLLKKYLQNHFLNASTVQKTNLKNV
jgi:hypothetical protein